MTDFPCYEPMTDPEIPDSLVDVGVAGIGTMETQIPSLSTFQAQAVVRAVLAAALPHLRPLFEVGADDAAARWALLYSDAVDNGNELAQELRQDLKVATQVGLELGRKEAAEEIAQRFLADARQHEDDRGNYQIAQHYARIAREVATRTADARTDPTGHTDLPPTPDALSNRLPEEGS